VLLAKALTDLQQLERELVEQRLLRRDVAQQRIEEATRRLGEIGSPAGVLARSAEELGGCCDFDRVLVSRVTSDSLQPVSLWSASDQPDAEQTLEAIARRPIPLRYPLVEAEVVQRLEAQLVELPASGPRALPELAAALGWRTYLVAPIVLERKIAGLLHADRAEPGDPVDELDLELAVLYADALGRAFERAVLRDKLQRQRRQLQLAGQWVNGQILRISAGESSASPPELSDAGELAEGLTRREHEVLRLIAKGMSNREIATSLVLGEGTVKYHVKNVLRKLHARSRAEAVSTYMRVRKQP
jgi:DNA-binding CsgD family transcriptional regulator